MTTIPVLRADENRCPHAKGTSGYSAKLDEYIEGADMCDLVDKWCLLEGGLECETYNEFLKERDEENRQSRTEAENTEPSGESV